MSKKVPATFTPGYVLFHHDLMFNVAVEHPMHNIVFSPTFIRCTMELLYQGAFADSADELKNLLRMEEGSKEICATETQALLQKSLSDAVKITVKTGIFLNSMYKISETFKDLANTHYNTQMININFDEHVLAAECLNHWVSKKSSGIIKNIYPKNNFSPDTKVLVVNFGFVKAKWANPFDATLTEKKVFNVARDRKLDIEMMQLQAKFKIADIKFIQARVIELPFVDSEISIYIFLPKEINGLHTMVQNMQVLDLRRVAKKLTLQYVNLQLPKMHYRFDMSLKEVLNDMGLHKIFGEESDLSGVVEDNEILSITDIHHIGYIDFNELGTNVDQLPNMSDSSASTENKLSSKVTVHEFNASHPFFWIVRDADQIYFCGSFANFTPKRDISNMS